jgi:hypothetical protein
MCGTIVELELREMHFVGGFIRVHKNFNWSNF